MAGRTLRNRGSRVPVGGLARILVVALVLAGCAPRPLLTRAIRARGGPLHGIVRQVEADVHPAVVAGTWHWRTAFLLPHWYAWTIYTSHGADHYVFDGTITRAFSGDREVAAGSEPSGPLRTQAGFTAAIHLDALLLPGARVVPLPAGDLPQGVAAGLAVGLGADAARFRLGFDARDLLVWAAGPVDLPPLGRGELVVRFSDFRRVGGRVLPHHAAYTLDGIPLAEERTLAACPNDPALVPSAFVVPDRLPACPP